MTLSRIIFPKPLQAGSHLAITGPSGGVVPKFHGRLDFVIRHLRERGFKVSEGNCLREEKKHVSAEKSKRAEELMVFFHRFDLALLLNGGVQAV